jgi:hypothetical protein
MSKWSADRWAASTGVGFAILLLVGGLLPGNPKKWNASPAEIESYLQGKHRELLLAGILWGVGYVLILWFLASFAGMFREAGQGRLAAIVYGAGIATTVLGAVSDGLGMALAKVTYNGDPHTVATLYGVQTWFTGRLFWTLTALALATWLAVWRSKALPDWYGWLTLLAAVVFTLGGIALRNDGFFSIGGGMGLVALLASAVWIALSSVLLVQWIGAQESSSTPTPSYT